MAEEKEVLLEVTSLRQYLNVGRRDGVRAIDDVSSHIFEGETFGLVGESGSGKSATSRSVICLYDPAADEILFDRKDISKIGSETDMQALRYDAQVIFQDPYVSSNPRMKINDIIAKEIDVNRLVKTPKEREEKVNELLKTMGLNPSHSTHYPHESSGGQRQRIGIARTLAVNPRFIIYGESTSALDVSIQTQIVNLLQDLQGEQGLTYSFITHDLSMVKHTSDRIGIMHSEKLLEMGTSDDVYNFGVHPYTENLLSAIPLPDPNYERTCKRIAYQPATVGRKDHGLREILNGHYVYCAEDEVAMYHEKVEGRKRKAGL